MAPTHMRQLLVWSAPTVAVLLTFLWYRKNKRCRSDSEHSDLDPRTSTRMSEPADIPVKSPAQPVSPVMSCSEPIDIRPAKSSPVILSDSELDMEIEKLKSMKSGVSYSLRPRQSPESCAPAVSAPVAPRAQSTERDSANHSPVDVLLASPSLSSISDNRSEEGSSSDSGKGGSDMATPPLPLSTADDGSSRLPSPVAVPVPVLHEFMIPQQLVGRLIGKHGAFVQQIKLHTGALVLIKKNPDSGKMKVCTVQGAPAAVDAALAMIRDKFPAKRYPDLTLEHVEPAQRPALVPDCMHLKLVEGTNNDAMVSCVVAPNHLFLQQPTHPTFPNLNVLTSYMNACYSQANSPLLPAPVQHNTICAAFSAGTWCRATVVSSDPEQDVSCIKFMDFGGYTTVSNSLLRQIRGDFLLLPFQAAECVLADVQPPAAGWADEAFDAVAELTGGALVCTQVVDYLDDGLPLVHVYVRAAGRVLLLNAELVRRGLALRPDAPR